MIVWGGRPDFLSSGGRYDPATDTWTATDTDNAPSPRWQHTAVWTGSEMIVWGGEVEYITSLNAGGRYDPATDSWTATARTNAPSARAQHTAVWTGSEMIVWGGSGDNTGGATIRRPTLGRPRARPTLPAREPVTRRSGRGVK